MLASDFLLLREYMMLSSDHKLTSSICRFSEIYFIKKKIRHKKKKTWFSSERRYNSHGVEGWIKGNQE